MFVISTTGQGELPANAQKFWRLLRSARLPPGCLQRLQFTSFGLGDSSYTQFNWAHRKLTNRLLQLGGQVVCDRAESDEQHAEGVDGAFVPWLTQLRGRILDTYPLPDSITAIPDDVLLEPRWTLQKVDDSAKSPRNGENGVKNHVSKDIAATIANNERVTSPKHWQDVRHLTLHLDGDHKYVPGDVIVIQPKNFPIDVDHILETCGWTSIADDDIQFTPTNQEDYNQYPNDYPTVPIPALQNERFTLRELLTDHLDIMSIPRRSFFAHLVHYSDDEFHVERLKEFINPELIDELFDYTTRPRRSILEVLDEFRSVKLSWQKVCSVIPVLRGRQFSIASGGVLKSCPEPATSETSKTKVELLIAIVKYKTVIKRVREGVCTRYIASLQPDQQISVTLQKGGLHPKESDMIKPVVMIGPGTGVAPMRSLIYERAKWREDHGHAVEEGVEDLLFFGCRNEQSDYFFKEEWARFETEGSLKPFIAFSRDQVSILYSCLILYPLLIFD